MATGNPFDLLGDDDNDDPSHLIAVQQQIVASKKAQAPTQAQAQAQPPKPAAKLPSKPLPPAQAVREAKSEPGRGGGRGGGRGYGRGRGRGGGGFNREAASDNSFTNSGISSAQVSTEELDTGRASERRGGYGGPRGSYRGGRRGAFSNGDDAGDGERPRRVYERHSGTGRGNEYKREGAGRGNWGTPTDEITPVTEEVVNDDEKNVSAEKPSGEEDATDVNKETPAKEEEEKEKEPEDKEMTLEEYEKVLEEKRKALQALKTEERKVDVKEFASMQQLSSKKDNDDVFVKLGSDKDKRKEFPDKEEKSKKPVSINEFLKPAEGDRYFNRGRGRGRGPRGGYGGGDTSIPMSRNVAAPKIEDPGQFPTLGAK
ncbi:RGG repeats nuclear RNA binding protein A-like [Rhododendron vialii]|uniref:RGG repeats nuclear RNA binding protein A-like n=1 Tax=Rhododendron vialii TaxID=182163 RepID=UPI00265DE643|nr:RGG repeats nuclear RNA binding protein A-like [Rhododendron vialii]